MTSKKRRYGVLSEMPPPSSDPDLIDDVFEAFTGKRTSDAPGAAPPVDSTAPPISTPVEITPPVKNTPDPLGITAPVETIAPVESTPKKGYLRLPNELVDNILPTMRPAEAVVLLRLYRLSWGNGKPTCQVSLPTLALRCRLSESQTRFAIRNVEIRGYIKSTPPDHRKGQRATVFEVLIGPVKTTPPAETTPPVEFTSNKRKDLKEQGKRGVCPQCKDTGWWYPEGVAKGVKRCSHERQKNGEA
jgi:hypothetical protein